MSGLARRFVVPTVAALTGVGVVLALLPTPEETPQESVLPSETFLIRDVRLFDGERVMDSTSVLVRDGRVASIGDTHSAADLRGVATVDGAGRTLLPGLIDAHTHSWGDALERALAFGVTAQFDQFGDVAEARRLAQEQEQSGAPGRADLISAGTLVTAAGGHGTQFGLPIPTLARPDDAETFVAARLDEGSAWIKVVIEDGSTIGRSLPTLDAATVQAVVEAGHTRGALVVAHVHSLAAARVAVAAGVDGLVHTVFDELPEPAFAEQLASRGVFVVPTLSVIAGLEGGESPTPGTGRALAADPRLMPWLRASERRTLEAGLGVAVPNVLAAALESVRRWASAGVPLVAGTDVGNPGISPGVSLHGELELLVAAGLSPLEALVAATSRPATVFRQPGRGRIVAGARADLVLVEGNPLDDITATRSIVGVWKAGQLNQRELALAASRPPFEPGPGAFSQFDEGSLGTSFGAEWTVSTDDMMSGRSAAALGVETEGEVGFLRVTGDIREGFPFPWAGAMVSLGAVPMEAVSLGQRHVLELRARGDAFRVMVLAEGLARPVETRVEASSQWHLARIDLADIGVPTEAVQAILLVGGPQRGEFGFEVDWVGLGEAGGGGEGPGTGDRGLQEGDSRKGTLGLGRAH